MITGPRTSYRGVNSATVRSSHEAGLEARGPLEPYFFLFLRRAIMFSPSISAEKAMAA